MCKCSLNEHDKAHAVTYCGRSQPQLMAVCVVPLEAATWTGEGIHPNESKKSLGTLWSFPLECAIPLLYQHLTSDVVQSLQHKVNCPVWGEMVPVIALRNLCFQSIDWNTTGMGEKQHFGVVSGFTYTVAGRNQWSLKRAINHQAVRSATLTSENRHEIAKALIKCEIQTQKGDSQSKRQK